jgi:hypothetical protein
VQLPRVAVAVQGPPPPGHRESGGRRTDDVTEARLRAASVSRSAPRQEEREQDAPGQPEQHRPELVGPRRVRRLADERQRTHLQG